MKYVAQTGLFLFLICSVSFAQTDKRIEEISRIYQETNEKIAAVENGEVFLNELVINKK